MARQTTIISIFLASPSDVFSERNVVVKSIDRWNAIRGRSQGYLLELLSWENATSAALAADGQDAVNKQIGDDYDAMIALFWHRLGSPTSRDVSGTAEEYSRALRRAKEGEPIEIGVYFKSSNPPMSDIDPLQLKGVMDLRGRMQEDGIYHKSFLAEDDLSFEIELFLDKLVRSHQSGALVRPMKPEDGSVLRVKASDSQVISDDDLGYLDLIDSLNTHSSRMTAFLSESSKRLEDITITTSAGSQAFDELVALGSPDPVKVKAVIAEITNRFNAYGDVVENGIENFAENMHGLAQDSIGIIRVSSDFPVDEGGVETAKKSLIELLENISSAMESMSEFAGTVQGLQRMTVAFNQAKKRVVISTLRMVEIMQSTRIIIEEAIRIL